LFHPLDGVLFRCRNTDIEPLEGVVEVNRTELLSRVFYPSSHREELVRIFVAGALEVTPVGEMVPILDPCPPRTRLATIRDSSAGSIEAFVRAHVKGGATLITDGNRVYSGLTDYHLDPREYGKPLRRTQQVFGRMREWFSKADTLDRAAVDRGLPYFLRVESRPAERHASFQTLLGLALRYEPTTCWDRIGRSNPRRGLPTTRRRPRRRKTATGMRQDGSGRVQTSNPIVSKTPPRPLDQGGG
jgi:hypothetical protein